MRNSWNVWEMYMWTLQCLCFLSSSWSNDIENVLFTPLLTALFNPLSKVLIMKKSLFNKVMIAGFNICWHNFGHATDSCCRPYKGFPYFMCLLCNMAFLSEFSVCIQPCVILIWFNCHLSFKVSALQSFSTSAPYHFETTCIRQQYFTECQIADVWHIVSCVCSVLLVHS